MSDREKLVELLEEIADYFEKCRHNASFGSKAEEHFFELRSAARDAQELLKEQEPEEDETESSVRQEDVETIMNLIEKALRKTVYQTVGYDNTCIWLQVFIDRR